MRRRKFLKLGLAGASVTAAIPVNQAMSSSLGTNFDLTIAPANVQMIDGTHLYMLLHFLDNRDPRPVLRVREGSLITINVTNSDNRVHGFSIPGIAAATILAIDPGASASVSFTAPMAGSFLYVDPYLAPLYRIAGLHGGFIVEPLDGTTPNGTQTPFSRAAQTPQIAAIFDAFGTHPRFPGSKWDNTDSDREKIWIFSQADPLLNAQLAAGTTINPAGIVSTFLPRYFMINGRSGFDTAVHGTGQNGDNDAARMIMPSGRQGQPCLIRTMNAGLATHGPHIHGNHVLECSESDEFGINQCEDHVYERDAWLLKPLQRIDVMLPFERPPDIPLASWPPREEPFPLRYVMHCHIEMSQTAGGGNYPQGCVTHWEMTGAL